MRKIFSLVIGAVLGLAAAGAAAAAERKALPPFTLTTVDGTSVESGALAAEGTWIFVYVQARCVPCDAVLAQIDSDERAAAPRIAIVGAGMDADQMAVLAAKHPNLKSSRWLADPARAASSVLGVKAMPTVFGLRGSFVEWRLAGTVRSHKDLESILFTWLEKR